MSTVLDASAFLAYLHGETGVDLVADAIASGATIGAANLAETLSKLADADRVPTEVLDELRDNGILDGLLVVEPLTSEDAVRIAEIRAATGRRDLSLGDRACLALAMRLGLPVLTADSMWGELGLDHVELRPIR